VVAGVVLLLVLRNAQLDTLIVGGGAILVLLLTQVRQRRLRQIELRGLTGGTEEMLNQSVERVQATLKLTRFQLIGLAPATLLGGLFAAVVQNRTAGGLLPQALAGTGFRILVIGLVLAFIAGLTVRLLGTLRRERAELDRLVAMSEAYQRERDSTTSV
jgi:hypothetical protein